MKCTTCNGTGTMQGKESVKLPGGGKFQSPEVGAGLKGILKPPMKNPGSRSKGKKYLSQGRRFSD